MSLVVVDPLCNRIGGGHWVGVRASMPSEPTLVAAVTLIVSACRPPVETNTAAVKWLATAANPTSLLAPMGYWRLLVHSHRQSVLLPLWIAMLSIQLQPPPLLRSRYLGDESLDHGAGDNNGACTAQTK